MNSWQPMDTAPRDGRRIMAWDRGNLRAVFVTWEDYGARSRWQTDIVGDMPGHCDEYTDEQLAAWRFSPEGPTP